MDLEDLGLNRNYLIALEEVTGDSGLWPLSGKGGSSWRGLSSAGTFPLKGLDHGWGQGDTLGKPGKVPGTGLSLVQREKNRHQVSAFKGGRRPGRELPSGSP